MVTYVKTVQHVEHVIGAARIVPVVVLADPAGAEPLASALVAGGLHCVEVTFRTESAAEVIQTVAQVERAAEAGARFVVSPGFGPPVVRRCQELGVPVFPGIATATEIQMALDAGLDTVKFFPAEQLGGVAMVKALAAPFRAVRFIPTGGVNTGNLADYLAVPSVLAVGGTWMVAPDLLAAGDWAEVTRRSAAAVTAARR
jgi:2-dehydro-3-deoxyphosphogluconate aldolase/(4S)-4-hydroxy-2-oxoglutarate aldolase